jgi:hypothetical protein
MDWSKWVNDLTQVIVVGGPWAAMSLVLLAFSGWILWNHFRLNSKTIEAMTAVKTMVEHLECQKRG